MEAFPLFSPVQCIFNASLSSFPKCQKYCAFAHFVDSFLHKLNQWSQKMRFIGKFLVFPFTLKVEHARIMKFLRFFFFSNTFSMPLVEKDLKYLASSEMKKLMVNVAHNMRKNNIFGYSRVSHHSSNSGYVRSLLRSFPRLPNYLTIFACTEPNKAKN